jgi:hypothetical protein
MSTTGSTPPDEAPEPGEEGFDGIALTRRAVTAGLLAYAGAASAAGPIELAQARPASPPAPPAPPRPAIPAGQSFAISAAAPPGTLVGTLATTGPAATGFAITAGNTGSVVEISPLGTLVVAPDAALRPGTLALTVVARDGTGTGQPSRVNLEILPAEPFQAIAPLTLEGTGAPAGTVTSFAMPFAAGDVPAGAQVALLRGATPLRIQANVLKQHADGSARHVMFAVETPALAEGARLETRIAVGTAHPDPGPELDLAAGLAGRDAVVTLTQRGSGQTWRCDLLANLPTTRWLRGPLLAQARVQVAVPEWVVGGVTSVRLFADLTLHKDGALGIDLQIRNDIAFIRSGGTARYGVTLRQDGVTTLSLPDVTQTMYATLMRVQLPMTLRGGGTAPARPHVRHDLTYLAERARVCANFDRRLGVAPAVETEFRNRMRHPDWDGHPFPSRNILYAMGSAGVREDMGPITRGQAAWLIDGHRTFRSYSLGQSEATAGCPWNMWDPTGGPRRRGAWINLMDRQIWADWRDSNFFPRTEQADTPWGIAQSHMPSGHFIPYILTGKRAILDALCGQASWALAIFTPGANTRGTGWDPATGEGMIVNRGDQWRTHAWTYREILNAAYACPPSEEPHPGYFETVARGNMNWFVSRIPAYEAVSGELAGHFRDSYGLGTPNDIYSYHTEYMLSSLIKAAWFDIPGAREYLRWSLNWHAGRFLNEPAFYPSSLVRFSLNFPHFNLRSWEALEAAQRPSFGPLPVANWNRTGEASFDTTPFVAMNIASLVDLFPDDPRTARAWRWFQRRNVPDIPVMTPAAFAAVSARSAVPMGRTRATAAPAVAPGQAFRVPDDTNPGSVAGVVRTTGGLATDYAIVGGTGAPFFTIDDAGVLTLAEALDHDAAPALTLSVVAGNATGRSAATAILVEVPAGALTAPTLASAGELQVAANARPGYLVGLVERRGGPARVTIASGNRDRIFAIDPQGRIEVARALTNLTGQRLELRIEARNRVGADARSVTVAVIPPQAAPNLAETTLEVMEGAAPGTELGVVRNTGGAARYELTGGGGGRFGVELETGQLRVRESFARVQGASHPVTIRATNATGAATTRVTINVLHASYVHRATELEHRAAVGLRRVRDNYQGPLLRAVRIADGAELDIGPAGDDGLLDIRAVVAFARGGRTEVATWYDQSPVQAHWRAAAAANRPLLTGPDGLPFPFGRRARPALRFRDNRGLVNTEFALAGTRNMAIVMAWQHERRPDARNAAPHLLAFHPDQATTGDTPRLLMTPDGLLRLQQPGNIGSIVSGAAAPAGAPVVVGVTYRGGGPENQFWWLNGNTAHTPASGLTYEFPRESVARLGHNGPGAGAERALDGLVAEMYVTEGAAAHAGVLAGMGRALADHFGA